VRNFDFVYVCVRELGEAIDSHTQDLGACLGINTRVPVQRDRNTNTTLPKTLSTQQELIAQLARIQDELATHSTKMPRQSFSSQIKKVNRLMRAAEHSASGREDMKISWMNIKRGMQDGFARALNINNEPDKELIKREWLQGALDRLTLSAKLLKWVATGAKTA